jgi:hypothetical protein
LLALATAALLGAGFAACGGGSSSDSSATSSAPTTTTANAPAAESGTAGPKTKADGGSGENAKTPPPGGSGGANEKGAASFAAPTGDNSIQSFGEEAKSGEIAAVEKVLSSYLDARARGEWARSCRYLNTAFVEYLEKTIGQSAHFKKLNCTAIIAAISAAVPAAERKNTLTNGVAALRVGGGERGYVLYHAAGDVDYTIAMANEDGVWKVAGLAPTVLPSSNPAE